MAINLYASFAGEPDIFVVIRLASMRYWYSSPSLEVCIDNLRPPLAFFVIFFLLEVRLNLRCFWVIIPMSSPTVPSKRKWAPYRGLNLTLVLVSLAQLHTVKE